MVDVNLSSVLSFACPLPRPWEMNNRKIAYFLVILDFRPLPHRLVLSTRLVSLKKTSSIKLSLPYSKLSYCFELTCIGCF